MLAAWAPRQTSSASTSRNVAIARTGGPSTTPGRAASAALSSESSRNERSPVPISCATNGSAGSVTRRPGRIAEIVEVAPVRKSGGWDALTRVEEVMERSSFVELKSRIWRLLREQQVNLERREQV